MSQDHAMTDRPIKLLYFAWVRERIGRPEEIVHVPHEVTTVEGLVTWLRLRGPEYAHAFARPDVIRTAVDHHHAKPGTALAGAREIAFFPPVTGG